MKEMASKLDIFIGGSQIRSNKYMTQTQNYNINKLINFVRSTSLVRNMIEILDGRVISVVTCTGIRGHNSQIKASKY